MNPSAGSASSVRFFISIACAAMLVATAGAQQIAVKITHLDVTQFPTVTLKIRITRDNIAIPNLNNARYDLDENGMPQNIERIDCALDSSTRLSIGLLIDRSGSMTQKLNAQGNAVYDRDSTKIRAAKSAVRVFISHMESRDEAAVMSFSSSQPMSSFFALNQDFTKDTSLLSRSLVPIKAEGGTYLWRAITETVNRTAVRPGKKYVIVLTDGRSQSGDDTRQSAIAAALAVRIPVYVIGLGADVSESELADIATKTGGRYYKAPDPTTLEAIYLDLARIIISDGCELRYTSSNPCLDGTLRAINLRVRSGSLSAEDDTFYTVASSLSSYTLAVEGNLQVTSGQTVEVPIFLKENITLTEKLTYDLRVTYDPALLTFTRLVTSNSISEGATVTLTYPSPGVVRMQLGSQYPRQTSGTVGRLEFIASYIKMDTNASVSLQTSLFEQNCPTQVSSENGSIAITPCIADYGIEMKKPLWISAEEIFDIPITIAPTPAKDEIVSSSFTVAYDTSRLRFVAYDAKGMLVEKLSVSVVRVPGGLHIAFGGVVTDTSSRLLSLKFAAREEKQSYTLPVEIRSLLFDTRCVTTSRANEIMLSVDGRCGKLVLFQPQRAISAYPNPFNPTTRIRYIVEKDAFVRVAIVDALGRTVATLAQGTMHAGDYSVAFDATDFPSGVYYAVLDVAGERTIHRILSMR